MCFWVVICVLKEHMRFWCIFKRVWTKSCVFQSFICVFDVFYCFLMHLSSSVRADRVPAALRWPRKKHDPDFLSSLCALHRACGASETSKKRHSWILGRVSYSRAAYAPILSLIFLYTRAHWIAIPAHIKMMVNPDSRPPKLTPCLIKIKQIRRYMTLKPVYRACWRLWLRSATFRIQIPPTNQGHSRFSNSFDNISSLVP